MSKQHKFSRTEQLIGEEAIQRLYKSTVAIFGIGGVGTYTVEALARSGVGKFILIDDDLICETNINRQIHATMETVGRAKVEVMKERVLQINPDAQVEIKQVFYLPNTEGFDWNYDYVVDAVDTVTAKIDIISQCKSKNIRVISAMGAGNKIDASKFEVADISKTSICPLAKVMRKELKKRNIEKVKVVYSKEAPMKAKDPLEACKKGCICPSGADRKCVERRQVPASMAHVVATLGMIIAGEVIKDITEI